MYANKEKMSPRVEVNFNNSKEISYWAKKLNIDSNQLQQKFKELNFSIRDTIQYCQEMNRIQLS